LFHQGTRVTEDKLLSADDFHALIGENNEAAVETIIIGLTEGLPAPFITVNFVAVRALATPHSLAAIAEIKLAAGETVDPMTATPIYLRAAADR
jgi:tRNA A37 threonylcarbamoyladenosine modification protein TsaB